MNYNTNFKYSIIENSFFIEFQYFLGSADVGMKMKLFEGFWMVWQQTDYGFVLNFLGVVCFFMAIDMPLNGRTNLGKEQSSCGIQVLDFKEIMPSLNLNMWLNTLRKVILAYSMWF